MPLGTGFKVSKDSWDSWSFLSVVVDQDVSSWLFFHTTLMDSDPLKQ